MTNKQIKKLVDSLYREYSLKVPVNLSKVASIIDAKISEEDLDALNISGFAFQKHGNKIIGVNSSESGVRQRFTIAHELGHLFLHKQHPLNLDDSMMLLRDDHASEGTDKKEVQANRFAAELLMPEEALMKELSKHGEIDLINMEEDSFSQLASELADKFNVSVQAMSVRLTSLYFAR